ncbi:MAG: short-chain dehydrogenase [Proteobacteria bacterium]|nr:short-chain dehydrogenase [Pseudomonadota bacterium]
MSWRLDFQGTRVLVTAGTKGVGKAVVGVLKQVYMFVDKTRSKHCPYSKSVDTSDDEK